MIALVLAASLWMPGQIAESAPADLAPRVRALVFDLDAAELQRRDQAERQLRDIGIAVLDLLPPVTETMPAETALRLSRVRLTLERERARKSVEAARIRLTADAMPLADVLQALAEQSGNQVFDFRRQFGQQVVDAKLSFELGDLPFWEALDRVADEAHLTTYPYADQAGIALVTRGPNERPRRGAAAYSGAFRIEAVELHALRDLKDSANDHLALRVQAAWEPRLKPIVIMQPLDSFAATDEQGRAIPLAGANGQVVEWNLTPEMNLIDLPVRLQLPPRTAQRIASLKGRFDVLLPGRVETFRFDDLPNARRRQQRRAAVTVVVDETRRNNQLWEVRLRVVLDEAHGALESHRTWIYNNPAYLQTADGQRIDYDALETTRQTENEVGLALLFARDSLAGLTLVYETPGMLLDVPIEFELTDMPLP